MFVHCVPHVALVVFVDASRKIAGGDEGLGIVRRDFVAGELLLDELRVRLVAVERPDDVVAVAPGVRPIGVLLVAVGFGVAHQVEPVAGPALAVVRAGEQAIDQLLVGVGRSVVHEGVHLLRRRRQADQVEGDAADERAAVGRWRRGQGLRAACDSAATKRSIGDCDQIIAIADWQADACARLIG